MKRWIGFSTVPLALLLATSVARAEVVAYSANLNTSKGNPVTSILILEANGTRSAHATVYPVEVPGQGTVVISHDAAITPTRTLIIGVTEGVDENGIDKTQLVMFLDPDFAAANANVPFSSVFPGARHSETITRLQAAVAGDVAELAWFTGTFFTGPAAGAAFASDGAFVVAEFTSLDIIGTNATAGNWMITSFQALEGNHPNAQSNRDTALMAETAKVDTGPFDIELSLSRDGQLAFDKTVLNDTGVNWSRFLLTLGTGTGANFVPSTAQDALSFQLSLNNREESGAFPTLIPGDDRIEFSGFLAAGGTARFVVFVDTNTIGTHLITLRQIAIPSAATAPMLGASSLAILTTLLCVVAAFRLRGTAPRRKHRS